MYHVPTIQIIHFHLVIHNVIQNVIQLVYFLKMSFSVQYRGYVLDGTSTKSCQPLNRKPMSDNYGFKLNPERMVSDFKKTSILRLIL